jgi:N12 class adenine-specific DNA methylase
MVKAAGGLVGMGVGSLVGSGAIQKIQGYALEKFAPDTFKELQELQQGDYQKHPVAALAGDVAGGATVFKMTPLQSAKGLATIYKIFKGAKVAPEEMQAAKNFAVQAGFGASVGVVSPLTEGRKPTLKDIGQATAQNILFGDVRFGGGGAVPAAPVKPAEPAPAGAGAWIPSAKELQRTMTERQISPQPSPPTAPAPIKEPGKGDWIEYQDDYGNTLQGKVDAVWKVGRIIPGRGASEPRIEYTVTDAEGKAQVSPKRGTVPKIIDKPTKPAEPKPKEANEPNIGQPRAGAPGVDVREPAESGPGTPPSRPVIRAPGQQEPTGAPPGGSAQAAAGTERAGGVRGGEPGDTGAGGRPGVQRPAPGAGAGARAGGGVPETPGGVVSSKEPQTPPPSIQPPAGNAPPGETSGEISAPQAAENHILPETEDWIPSGDKAKTRANLDAIKLLKKLEAENRNATPEEKAVLARYVGWGGLKEVFDEGKAAYRERPPWNDDQKKEFDNWERSWGKLYDEVKGNLTEEEHAAAGRSILNAHYTSRDVINAVWKGVQRLGFKGGNALEPSAGVGNFIGLTPQAIRAQTHWRAVELDSISGRILGKLYPKARVDVAGFQDTRISPNSQDLVISNFPFDAAGPTDKRYPKLSLHNYFFARSLDLAKPGGLVAAITSDSTMDGASSRAARDYFAGKADLVGAIRLPNTAFKKNAGTEVTTDILFFRKHDNTAFQGQGFTRTLPAETYKHEPIELNEYYAQHPDMMLGRMSLEGRMYAEGQQALIPTPGGDLNQQMAAAVAKLPENVMGSTRLAPAEVESAVEMAESGAKMGQLQIRDGVPMVGQPDGTVAKPDWAGDYRKVRQAVDYVGMRDGAVKLIDAQLSTEATEADIADYRKKLNTAYDVYYKKYGSINERRSRFLDDDVDFPLALALEDEKTRLVKVGGKDRRVTDYVKSRLFTERTIFPRVPPEHVDTVEDALQVSQNFMGKADPDYIAQLTGRPVDAVKAELEDSGRAFENPGTGRWENRATYLSGFVKKKLAEARNAAGSDPRYARHVAELEKVQPPLIGFENIGVKLGSVFVPESTIEQFLRDKLGVNASVSFVPQTGNWHVEEQSGQYDEKNKTLYGIHGWTGAKLVQESLNLKMASVYDTVRGEDGKPKEVRNAPKSLDAQQKQDILQREFKDYIRSSPEIGRQIEQIYNDKYNGVVAPKFEPPTWAHYPGASADITLREHQKAVVTRMLQNSTLLAHAVGTGKTYAMVTTAMEMRRLGLAKKPMMVVQNATLEQFASSFKKLYPTARILVPNARQRDAVNRNKTMSRIATGNWDAVIIPQSFVNMLPDDPARERGYIQDRLDELESAKIEAAHEAGKRSPKARDLQKAIARLQDRLAALADRKKDAVMTFEQLGVDAMFVDEAHAYKKLEFSTKMDNIKGLDSGASQRGWSMYMKTRWAQEKNQGRNVIFATGTPVSNTIAEAWNMMRYVRPDVLKEYGIEKFDDFASTFGDTVTQLEMTAGGTWKPVTRFARYANGPELIAAWRTVADVVTAEEVNLPNMPALKNGRVTVHTIKQSPQLTAYIAYLRSELERFAAMSGTMKRENSHIPLVVFGLAKKASLDMRMIDPDLADQPGSKLNVAADNIAQAYRDSASVKGAQMVFSDSYQNDPEKPRFNLYQELKKKLIEREVPEDQIVIIDASVKDAKREALFNKINDGDIAIVLGSTERMGLGVNAQEHMIALHHLDAPPRPMDIEQRNGRILRQGNQNPEVEIHQYGVENTLDAAMFQKLATKQKFINQILRGDLQGRHFEDAANEQSLSFEEQMAAFSGDPRAMEKVRLENQVRQLESLRAGHFDQVRKARETIQQLLVKTIPFQTKEVAEAQRRGKLFADAFAPEKDYTLQVGERTLKGRKDVAAELDKVFKAGIENTIKDVRNRNRFGNADMPLGTVTLNGQRIRLTGKGYANTKGMIRPEQVNVEWRFEDGEAGGESKSGPGFFHSLAATLERIAGEPDRAARSLANEQRNARELAGFVQQPFEREKELTDAKVEQVRLSAELEAEGKAQPPPPVEGEEPDDGGEETHAMAASAGAESRTERGQIGAESRKAPAPSRYVRPEAEAPAEGLLKDLHTLRTVVAPQAFGEQARFTGNVLRQLSAEMANELTRADKALRPFRNDFDRTPLPKNWKYDPTLALPRNLAFIDAYEGGTARLAPKEAQLSEELHRQNEEMLDQVHALGTGALENFYENYFPHLWADEAKAKRLMAASLAKRPLQGSRSFLKQRTHQFFIEGLAAGLKPVHDNPIDLWMLKRREVARYVMAQKFIQITREAGIPKFVYVFSKAPEGYKRVDDSAFTEFAPPWVTIKEAFDAGLRDKIDEVMDQLKISHARPVKIGGRGNKAGGSRWGYETGKQGEEQIVTNFGGPEFVKFHELGHALDSRYKDLRKMLFATDAQKEELKALARMRYAGESDISAQFEQNAQTPAEEVAVTLQAYLHSPELFGRLAPNVGRALADFIGKHPELRIINDIQPTLRLGEASARYPVSGLTKMGDWYYPEGAAYVLNNFLKPGLARFAFYRWFKEASNLLNGIQLVGGFHLGFVTGEAPINKLALAARDASLGHIGLAGKALLSAPLAPLTNLRRGYLLRKESMHPGSVGEEYAGIVKNLEAGGFHFSQDPYWRTHFTRRTMRSLEQAWTQLQQPGLAEKGYALSETGKALANLPWSVVEQVMRPVMEYFVPWQKAGAAMDMLGHDLIIENPGDAAALREVARKVSMTIRSSTKR